MDDEITKLKTNVMSAANEKKRFFWLGEACLAACSRGWVQHCGMTQLLNDLAYVLAKVRDAQSAQGRRTERARRIVWGN